MKGNRAKCFKCNTVIESLELHHYVVCSCGNAGLGGGLQRPFLIARDAESVSMVDDESHGISNYNDEEAAENQEHEQKEERAHPLTKDELLQVLDAMGFHIERLPVHANLAPVTQRDLHELILVLSSLFRSI